MIFKVYNIFLYLKEKNIIYMGEDIEEFLMNNEIDAMDLIKTNKWLTPGTRVRIG